MSKPYRLPPLRRLSQRKIVRGSAGLFRCGGIGEAGARSDDDCGCSGRQLSEWNSSPKCNPFQKRALRPREPSRENDFAGSSKTSMIAFPVAVTKGWAFALQYPTE